MKGSQEDPKNKMGAVRYLLFSIVALVVIVTPIQVYLNKPADRPIVACYNISKLHSFFWVMPWRIFAPKDEITKLDHSLDVQRTYRKCVNTLNEWNWLTSR